VAEEPFKFEIKSGATPASGDSSVVDSLGNPPMQAFRYKTGGTTAVIAVSEADLDVSDLKWEKAAFEHGSETALSAKIKNWDGKPVRFVVEYERNGAWKILAQVPATVKGGVATGELMVHHPVLPPTGSTPSSSKLQGAQEAQLRFSLERGEAQPQKRAEPQPKVEVPTDRPAVKTGTGTLTVKGALAGERFFLVDAGSGVPVKVGEGSKVKTATVAASGVMFILGKDRTAVFEKLPAATYKVIFPPEQVEGEKPKQPVVKANPEGAHVVDIKDFVHLGAICEIEVPPGGSPSLELTLSADGTARVCC
jgi:hypothetical protein